MNDFQEIIWDHPEEENRDLKYKIGDKSERLRFNMTPTIAYDYLLTDAGNQYSFVSILLHLHIGTLKLYIDATEDSNPVVIRYKLRKF